ncbi:MAG: tRNA lysidine(34) synthetase TilS [Clostridia bacterium]|jgi:tRNA(Ile)-lysidine synthase|nr:tRNA lysidine(34) synthetase TilS [Clostridia bacterium]
MEEFHSRIYKVIREYNMIEPGELILAGVSGGPDSLALLHVLWALQKELSFRLHVGHLDHSLRGVQAEEEALWVKRTAGQWGLQCTLGKTDVSLLAREKKISLQDAGHQARKQFFESLQKDLDAQKIALGHQSDDQAETLLMNFLSGAGSEGLSGILPVQGDYIRPLLFTDRADIEAYCEDHQLMPRRDPSNEKDIYLRNKIRLQLLPWLRENINPNLPDTLNRTARIFWTQEEYLREITCQAAAVCLVTEAEKIKIRLKNFALQHKALQRRLVRKAYQLSGGKQGLSFLHVEEVCALILNKQVGKTLPLPGDILVEKEYDGVVFRRGRPTDDEVPFLEERELLFPGNTEIPGTGRIIAAEYAAELPREIPPDTVYIPREEYAPPLYIRSRREGDKFTPAGYNKSYKLKEYFIDHKIPRKIRNGIPLLADEKGILWLIGLGCGNRVNKKSESGQYILVRFIGATGINN